jgi:hypothetical protein
MTVMKGLWLKKQAPESLESQLRGLAQHEMDNMKAIYKHEAPWKFLLSNLLQF